MASATSTENVGTLLRGWRQRRRITQLDLALDAGTSARHLSFVETGRSKPGRAMLLRVAERLEIPYRERNQMLLAAGHAPAFPERPLEDPELAPVRAALEGILAAHEPLPAIAVDRRWNIVAANDAATALVEHVDIDESLLEPPVNAFRIGLHPRGLAPYIINLADWRAHFLRRLSEQIAVTADRQLMQLMEELISYGDAGEDVSAAGLGGDGLLGPVRFRAPGGGEWSFFGMFAIFDTPFEVTTSELACELLFPADAETANAFKKGAP